MQNKYSTKQSVNIFVSALFVVQKFPIIRSFSNFSNFCGAKIDRILQNCPKKERWLSHFLYFNALK